MDVQGEDFLERVRKMRVTRLSRSAQHPGLVLLMRRGLVKRERERSNWAPRVAIKGPLNSASFAITSIVIGTFALAEMSVERVLFTRPRRQGHVPRRTRTLDRLGRLFSPDNVAAAAAAVMREMMTANDEEEEGRCRAKIEARLVGGI